MKTQYAIFNPTIGLYDRVDTQAECHEKLVELVCDFYLKCGHGIPVSIIEVNEDGSETWRNAKGEEVGDLNSLLKEQRDLMSKF